MYLLYNTAFQDSMKILKEAAYNHIISILDDKINTARKAVLSAKESRNNETKSSAGDKHETGRAMSQIELDNSEMQLGKVLNLKRQFLQLDVQKERNTIEPGCMVRTNNQVYFISIGLGKIQVKNDVCYVVSIQSPIGQAMLNKKIGDLISFQNKQFEIKEIL